MTFGRVDDSEELDPSTGVICGCDAMIGGGPTGKRCPATPATKPATSSTPMLCAG